MAIVRNSSRECSGSRKPDGDDGGGRSVYGATGSERRREPTGTVYTVVFQLDDGTVRTEYWSVPTTSPTTIAAVRTTPGTGLGNMAATQQYVNAAVANRALDSTVVHLAGTETITGQSSSRFAVDANAGGSERRG